MHNAIYEFAAPSWVNWILWTEHPTTIIYYQLFYFNIDRKWIYDIYEVSIANSAGMWLVPCFYKFASFHCILVHMQYKKDCMLHILICLFIIFCCRRIKLHKLYLTPAVVQRSTDTASWLALPVAIDKRVGGVRPMAILDVENAAKWTDRQRIRRWLSAAGYGSEL